MTDTTKSSDPEFFRGIYRVPSARKKGWDYSSCGRYFVTICIKDKQCWFGNIVETEEIPRATILLSETGNIIEQCWRQIPDYYGNVALDSYQIMPNHIHGILVIKKQIKKVTLGLVINQFKAACTKQIRSLEHLDFKWQERFHDHIIRNDGELERIRQYILNNPVKWLHGEDRNF